MGFNFTAFAGGFASALSEDIEKEEKLATLRGKQGADNMYENYKKVIADNRKIQNELKSNIDVLSSYDQTATPAELAAVASNKHVMDRLMARVKESDFDAANFKIADVVKVVGDNSTATALQRLSSMYTIPTAEKEEPTKRDSSGNVIVDIIKGTGSKAEERAARQTADALGVTLEQLKAAQNFQRTDAVTGATFNMAAFQKTKTFDQKENDAKNALLDATRNNDPKKINEAKADLLIFKSVKETLTPEQTAFSNKVADIKNRYMFGTPEERKAAKPEYDKLMADIRAEALAKKVGDGTEGKIPALGTLNTFTSAAVARAVAAKHGDLIKTKQLAIIEKADGSVGIDYIGDNDMLRRQILETQANAAKNALSLYTDAKGQPFNRDVASVLNSFTGVVPSVVRTDGATTFAAVPQPAVKPIAPTPTANLRREAEAAIAKGADRAAVAKRYKEQTGQEF